jgi:uncharacterized protein (TIGR03086 family)
MREDDRMGLSDVDLVETVLDETESIIAGVGPGQRDAPTPCSGFDVAQLINHTVGWARTFAARCTGAPDTENPDQFQAGPMPAGEFHQAAQAIVEAYRSPPERAPQLPAGFMVMEFLTHGWDLAAATNQTPTFSDGAAELGLRTAEAMLKPEYRGSAFLPAIDAPATAGPVDRLVAFMGRNPAWRPLD